MKKVILLILVSLPLTGLPVKALYTGDNSPKAHTICYNPYVQRENYQVYVTDLGSGRSRLDLVEKSIDGERRIYSDFATLTRNDDGQTFRGDRVVLFISQDRMPDRIGRWGQVDVIEPNSDSWSRVLRCDTLMHIMTN
ncbi:MAG: hypothetical protein COT73_13180 [Bdellovibrio sp. CG10_big_fil_rev_8_21_14_0_10_47_8]|nr:MAG: hypothetical protein COT73_13180 [Bdellovibrio sp. CG10_big_fil_rev_8_21_14_0_10_47_8]